MGTFNLESYVLDRKLDLPLNSFKTKAAALLQRATDVFIIKFYVARGSNDRQTFDSMNSIKLKTRLCQTLDVSNYKQIHPCLRYDFADRKI